MIVGNFKAVITEHSHNPLQLSFPMEELFGLNEDYNPSMFFTVDQIMQLEFIIKEAKRKLNLK